jgi:uncharacterized membrane-anchored protein YjiN (DUF445 family)
MSRAIFPVWTRLRVDKGLQDAMKEIADRKVVRVSSLIRQVLRDYAREELGREIPGGGEMSRGRP